MAEIVRTPTELNACLVELSRVRKTVPQLFLETRPAYMRQSLEPVAEPCHTGYLSFFEVLLEHNPSIAVMTDADISALFDSLPDLKLLRWPSTEECLRNRWAYERRKTWRQLRMMSAALRQEIVQVSMHPKRVGLILEQYGFEGLRNTFGGE